MEIKKYNAEVPENYTPTNEEKRLAELIAKKDGNISTIALCMKRSRRTVYHKLDKSPYLQAAINEARESFLDDCESVLVYHVRRKNLIAAIFALKTLAKDRGYCERGEVKHSGQITTVAELVARPTEEEKSLRKSSEFEN